MKIGTCNKIMIIQWTDKWVRQDIGHQKINARELVDVLEKCIKSLKIDYPIEGDL